MLRQTNSGLAPRRAADLRGPGAAVTRSHDGLQRERKSMGGLVAQSALRSKRNDAEADAAVHAALARDRQRHLQLDRPKLEAQRLVLAALHGRGQLGAERLYRLRQSRRSSYHS